VIDNHNRDLSRAVRPAVVLMGPPGFEPGTSRL
jgi:hypothetical protein